MKTRVFVAMPFGVKEGIDFDQVYRQLIRPALEEAGFDVFRADEEVCAGNIRTDMFQELIMADLVVADLSIDNPNVWYELGVRHALRSRGVLLIGMEDRKPQPFDVYTDRKQRYHLLDGVPDPEKLADDRSSLAEMAKATRDAWRGKKISPVYHHLPHLGEPPWKNLEGREKTEFWRRFTDWEERVETARGKGRPGDILVLAGEAPVAALRLEAYQRAGKALRQLGQFRFAGEQMEKALEIDPDDIESCREKGILLGRLGKTHAAKVLLQRIIKIKGTDPETLALLGRVEKDAWVASWRGEGSTPDEMLHEAEKGEAMLREAIVCYVAGFRSNPGHYYSAINAVTLMHLLRHLTGDTSLDEERRLMEGGLRWAVECALKKDPADYWARVTLADLHVLASDPATVEKQYRSAVAVADNDWFALDSSRQQLHLLRDLGFNLPRVEKGLAVLDNALRKLQKPFQPRQVFLFSGHMIDRYDRPEPRFPANLEIKAAREIRRHLDEMEATADDLGLCGGACGGDLLFAEACLERGMPMEIRLPFAIPDFLHESVSFAGRGWVDRFHAASGHQRTRLFIMPDEIGPPLKDANSHERNNLWQLYSALCLGPDKVRFLCLWDGKGGDGPGGTRHMHDEVEKRTGQVRIIKPQKLSEHS